MFIKVFWFEKNICECKEYEGVVWRDGSVTVQSYSNPNGICCSRIQYDSIDDMVRRLGIKPIFGQPVRSVFDKYN